MSKITAEIKKYCLNVYADGKQIYSASPLDVMIAMSKGENGWDCFSDWFFDAINEYMDDENNWIDSLEVVENYFTMMSANTKEEADRIAKRLGINQED